MTTNNIHILEDYKNNIETYTSFTKSVETLCKEILSSIDVNCQSIEIRTKTEESLEEKLKRPNKFGKYKNLKDITDISGVRIILYLQEDCKKFSSALKKHFIIDEENSIDKSFESEADRFGYLSIHKVVSHKQERTKLLGFNKYEGLKCEIQIRTVLQHAWSAIDWKLRYKTKDEIPSTLKRQLYRLSALLEVADSEFSTLNDSSVKLRNDYRKKISANALNIELNKDSIKSFIMNNPTFIRLSKEFNSKIMPVADYDSQSIDYGSIPLLNLAKLFEVKTLKDLENYIKLDQEKLIEASLKIIDTQKKNFPPVPNSINQGPVLRILLTAGLYISGLLNRDSIQKSNLPEHLKTATIEALEL